MAGIPDSEMREHLRQNDSLRSRNFPGFRITKAVPTRRQIWTAIKKELIDRSNDDLAYLLCIKWGQEHPAFINQALLLLGAETKESSETSSWIERGRERLEVDSLSTRVLPLTKALADGHSAEQVTIFLSAISCGGDCHQPIQNLINDMFGGGHQVQQIPREQIIVEIEAARQHTQSMQVLKVKLGEQIEDLTAKIKLELKDLKGQHDGHLAKQSVFRGDVEGLAMEIERLEAQRLRALEHLNLSAAEAAIIGEAIADSESKLEAANAKLESELKDTEDSISANAAKVLALEGRLSEIEKLRGEPPPIESDVQTTDHSSENQQTTGGDSQIKDRVALEEPTPLIGANAICYQAVQRIFRNGVVAFLRKTMVSAYPQDYLMRLKKPFGDDWSKAELQANLSRNNLGTNTAIRDDFDLLGTNHFFNIFELHFEKLFSSPRPVKARFMGNLKAIKDCRDPLSHPVEEEVSKEEAQHLLYCAREILRWMGCNDDAGMITRLLDQLTGEVVEAQTLLRRLPSEDGIYLDFVGRDSLLESLTKCFANSLNKRCLLAGDGGKGKSAAAYKFVRDLPAAVGKYQIVLWLSAKQRRFNDGGTTRIETPDFSNAVEAIDRILTEYGATPDDLGKDLATKKKLLFEYLNAFPAFIVADDIDSVLEDDDVVSLFTHEIPHSCSSVLLTSRRSIPGIRSLRVPGFDSSEAEEFIKSRVRLYDLDSTSFSAQTIKKITACTDGSPLYMDDLLRLAKTLSVGQAISIWTERGGDEARKYALQREIENLTIDSRKTLVAAAVQEEPISFAELKDILQFPDDRLLSALTELQTLFLIPKAPAVEGEQRYQINLNTKKLVRLVEGKNEFYSRIENRSKAISGKLPHLEQSVVAPLIRQAILLSNSDQAEEAERILLGAVAKYPQAADLHGVLGFVYRRTGRIADARHNFEAAYRLKSKNRDTYIQWVRMEIGEKEWLKAAAAAEKALKVIPDAYELVEKKTFALRQAGFDFQRRTHWEKATKAWTESVEEIGRSIRSPETLETGARALNASMYHTMVICLDMLGRFPERNSWLERWEREHPDDSTVQEQKEYLVKKRGSLSAGSR
jgi:tetratricopeptide (TPR) repeat protein